VRKPWLIVLPLVAAIVLVSFMVLRSGSEPGHPSSPPRFPEAALRGNDQGSPAPPSLLKGTTSRTSGHPAVDVPARFARLLARHASKDKSHYGLDSNRFAAEEELGLRGGRLLALAYPDRMLPLLLDLAGDPNRDRWDRLYAVHLLGSLARERVAAAESGLVRLAHQHSGVDGLDSKALFLANEIIAQLAAADQKMSHYALYSQKCSAGFGSAFYALSTRADPANVSFMQSLLAKSEAEEDVSLTHRAAGRVLKDYALLQSPEADGILNECIGSLHSERYDLTAWAVTAARARQSPALPGLLRRRLDESFAEAQIASARRRGAGLGPAEPFLEQYVTRGHVDGLGDRFHDDLLILTGELGGTLTDLERRRLRAFGYFVDPQERLLELLSAENSEFTR
jgi:hypothetical protein